MWVVSLDQHLPIGEVRYVPVHLTHNATFSRRSALPNSRRTFMSARDIGEQPWNDKSWDFAVIPRSLANDSLRR